MKSWMASWFTLENSATFVGNLCLTCRRLWYLEERPEGRPICLMNTYDRVRLAEEFDAGHPVEYDLPEWEPAKCSKYMEK